MSALSRFRTLIPLVVVVKLLCGVRSGISNYGRYESPNQMGAVDVRARTSSVEQCSKKPLGRFEAFGLILCGRSR
jgi:hypothetical protein